MWPFGQVIPLTGKILDREKGCLSFTGDLGICEYKNAAIGTLQKQRNDSQEFIGKFHRH